MLINNTDVTATHLNLKVDIEMDGKMLNSHGVDFLDGPLGLDIDEKDLDEEETRRDMAKILKELKQKHPDKEVGRLFFPFFVICSVMRMKKSSSY